MDYILIAMGGALGSVARFALGKKISQKMITDLPLGTFCINISGAFLLGFFGALDLGAGTRCFLLNGFLGAFTTFSTFMFEGVTLVKNDEYLNAFMYIIISLFLGIVAFMTAFGMAVRLIN